jgi:hypothetical protein
MEWKLYNRGLILLGLVVGLGLGSPNLAVGHDEPDPQGPFTPGSTWELETCLDHSLCGDLGPLLPLPTDPKGAGLIWDSTNWEVPRIHFKERHSEMRAKDMYDGACLEAVIKESSPAVSGQPSSRVMQSIRPTSSWMQTPSPFLMLWGIPRAT